MLFRKKKLLLSTEGLIEEYPNQTSGHFTLLFESNPVKDIIVEIFNSTGSCVYTEHVKNETNRDFDISGYPAGIYLIRIVSGKEVYRGKIFLK